MKILKKWSRAAVTVTFMLGMLIAWQAEANAVQLTLAWTDNSTNESGFVIQRSSSGATDYAEIGEIGPGATTYTDLSVVAATTYCYRVQAFNAAAYSGYTNVACAAVAEAFGLAVVKTGAGTGTVTSALAGIVCGASCSGSYPSGTAVTLSAAAAAGSTFTGWSGGGCSGTGTCTVTLTAATVVTATFDAVVSSPPTITVSSTSVQPGQSITVSFSGSAGQTQDFIALYVPGTPTDAYLSWRYLNGLTSTPSVAPASGSFTFPMPLTAGTYELRWIKDGNPYAVLATSPVITSSVQPPPAGQVAFVQSNYAAPQASLATVTVPFPAAQAAGNLNVVVIGWNDTKASVSAVTDATGNVYAVAAGRTTRPGKASLAIYYAKDIRGSANAVTVKFSTAAASPDIRILEYSGLDTVKPLVAAAKGSGSSATSSTGSLKTTVPNVLLVAANIVETATSAPGAGFTSRILTAPEADLVEDQMVSAPGTYYASATLSAVGYWIMQLVAFRAAN